MKKSVMCIVQTRPDAERIVSQIESAGFPRSDISVLLPNKSGTRDFAHEHNTKAPEGAIAGVGAGGAVGGALGLLVGIGALAIPGFGPFLAAGPLMVALSGAAAGAAVGGVTGALVGLGIPEIEARRYEGKIKGGNILISVHAEDAEQQTRIEGIFKSAKAEDIFATTEAAVPHPSAPVPMPRPSQPGA
jgi:hypothetical protein